jgi:hypothetical protein
MEAIWMAIAPGRLFTRVIAMRGASDTILKARLRRDPSHPRALTTLLEAIALWQGMPVRAAVAVDDEATSFGTCLCHNAFLGIETTPLYTVDWVPSPGRGRRRMGIGAMGEFRDLERLLCVEVAR